MIETDVLVIGGGPVGTMLAGELGWRGVRTTVFEERTTPTVHPKATLLGARSMEYRRCFLEQFRPDLGRWFWFCQIRRQ